MLNAVKYAHMLTLVIWIGSIIFFSFIGAPSIFKTLDRQTAGDVVGAIFPKYFLIWQVCAVLGVLTLFYIGVKTGFSSSVKAGLLTLVLMGGVTAYSSLVNAPQARDVKYQMRTETDDAAKEALRKKFGRLHGISMALNILTLVMGLVLLWFAVLYIQIS